MAIPAPCAGVGISRKTTAASAMVNSAWLCTITLASPTGTPREIAIDCARNWTKNRLALIAIRSGQEIFGLRTNRQGVAAMTKRSVVINSGGNSSSAYRLATNPNPQMTATRTAMATSAGFILLFLFLALLVRLLQQIGAVQRRVIIGGDEREADLGQHALH